MAFLTYAISAENINQFKTLALIQTYIPSITTNKVLVVIDNNINQFITLSLLQTYIPSIIASKVLQIALDPLTDYSVINPSAAYQVTTG